MPEATIHIPWPFAGRTDMLNFEGYYMIILNCGCFYWDSVTDIN